MGAPASSTRFPGLARIAVAATIWGSIGVLVRMVDANPIVIVFWRVALAGATIALYLAARRRLTDVFELPRSRRIALAVMGVLLALNWVLFFSAIAFTKVSVAVLLGYLGPVFVAAFTPLVLRERFDRRAAVPLVLALAGTIVIVGPQDLALEGGRHLIGAGLAIASAITYAMLILNAKRLLRGIPASVYMFGEYIAATIVLLPFVFLLDGPSAPAEWGALLTLGIVNTAVTGLLFLSGLRMVRADHASIITYAEPVSAVVFAAALLGERITLTTLAGGALVLAGGLAVARLGAASTVEGPPVPIEPGETHTSPDSDVRA